MNYKDFSGSPSEGTSGNRGNQSEEPDAGAWEEAPDGFWETGQESSPDDAGDNTTAEDPKDATVPMEGRPIFMVYDRPTPPYDRPGLWFHSVKQAKGDLPPEPTDSWICTPIHAEAQTHGADGSNHGLLLRFKASSGGWRTWAMPMHLLKGDGSDLRGELLDRGWRLDPNHRMLFVRWLMSSYPKGHLTAVSSTGWHASSFVLPARIIGDGKLTFQNETAADHYQMAGSLRDWRYAVGKYLPGNPLLILAVSAALAGPLLEPTARAGGGIHLVGDSSTGKTTALLLAASVWGAPAFVRTWRATANGLEGAASEVNDTALILDELSQSDPAEAAAITYAVGNGVGKTRVNRVGMAKRTARWRVMLLSSGERTLAAHMAEDRRGRTPKAGQLVRLLDIPVKRQFGLFDALHDMPTGAALADYLKKATAQFFGRIGPAFLDRLVAERENLDLPAKLAELLQTQLFHHPDGLHQRAAATLALCGMAGELARQWGLLPIAEGEAIGAAALAFRLWSEQQTSGRTEDRQILQAITDFIDRHGSSRFELLHADDPVPVRDRAGWLDDAGIYLFTSAGLREAVAGHDMSRALDALQDAGWLVEHDPGKRSKKIKVEGRPTNVYAIRVGEVSHG
ncbi:MAG: DUF927 domain-containing protein [Acidithiobacillus sp.]